jgi:hypothetical protein
MRQHGVDTPTAGAQRVGWAPPTINEPFGQGRQQGVPRAPSSRNIGHDPGHYDEPCA